MRSVARLFFSIKGKYPETFGRFPGIKFGGKMINNLRNADDTVLIAENEKDLQILLDIVVKDSHKKGLELNCKRRK